MAHRLTLDHEALEAIEHASDGPVRINVIGPSSDDPEVWRAELPADVGRAVERVAEERNARATVWGV